MTAADKTGEGWRTVSCRYDPDARGTVYTVQLSTGDVVELSSEEYAELMRSKLPKPRRANWGPTHHVSMPWRAYLDAEEVGPSKEWRECIEALDFEKAKEISRAPHPARLMKKLVSATLGQRIKHVLAQGEYFKRKDVAEVLSVTRPTLDKYLADPSSITVHKLMRLCEVFGVHPATVLGVMTPDTAELVDLYESCDATTRAQIIASAKAIAEAAGQPCEPYQSCDDYTTVQVTELCERLGIDPAEL